MKGEISVHVITAQGENIVAFSVPSIGLGLPTWTPDGEHLILFDKRILRAVQVDLRDPSRREPVGGKAWDGLTYHDGAIYGHFGTDPGLWQIDGTPRLITKKYPGERRGRLSFLGGDALVPSSDEGGDAVIFAQPLTGGPDHVAFYAPAAEPGFGMAVDPLTGEVIYVSEVSTERHVDLLTIAKQ